MSMPSLGQIRESLEGAIPAVMATCDAQGTPNVAFLSQVHYVDERHVALSYQFFNKTRRNILANPHGHLTVVNPRTARMHRMRVRYVRTESEGPLFERMKAHLEGIASHTGMGGVFRLLGSDVYEVTGLEALPGRTLPTAPGPRNLLAALRRCSEALSACQELGTLVDTTLDGLVREFGIEHAMFLLPDESGERLYTVGSRGYAASGVGSEIALGDGVIGVCARARTAIRVSWATQAYRYGRALRDVVRQGGADAAPIHEIPYPGLSDPHSQIGVPIVRGGRLLGVLFVESSQDLRFTYDDEDALMALGGQLGASLDALRDAREAGDAAATPGPAGTAAAPAEAVSPASGAAHAAEALAPMRVRRFRGSDSIFLDDEYLIKGVAGAIFWRLVSEHARCGRTEFSNRELRVDPEIRLPDVVDNLEARLILLRRRLAEQDMGVQLLKGGRGRLTLQVLRRLDLVEVQG